MLRGIVNLAPESLPVTVKIVFNVFDVPNNVLTVVAVKLIVVPITVLDTFVPTVEVVFKLAAVEVFTPTPSKLESVLESPIVAV
jgi:hypothetical protein